MKKISLVYFGTPDFSSRFLEKILTDVSINQLIDTKLVVTQPDKPVGRKQILTPSPVKLVAKKYGIPVLSSQFSVVSGNQKDNRLITDNRLLNTDLALLYAYGEIIPKQLLLIIKYGFWNIHPSLLPKYRGASPIAHPLILGDKKTGVTIIKMDEKLDHGPIIAQEELQILPTDRRPDLEIKLTDLAFDLFKKTISQLNYLGHDRGIDNILSPNQQNHQQATYTRLLKKDDGFISLSTLKKALNNESLTPEELPQILQEIRNWKLVPSEVEGLKIENSPKIIFDYFRGLYPWPGLWTLIEPTRLNKMAPRKNRVGSMKKRLKITDLDLIGNKLVIKKVQLEGKREVDFETFNRSHQRF